jgi:hypothetical protein
MISKPFFEFAPRIQLHALLVGERYLHFVCSLYTFSETQLQQFPEDSKMHQQY